MLVKSVGILDSLAHAVNVCPHILVRRYLPV